jgi:hypothetical protein
MPPYPKKTIYEVKRASYSPKAAADSLMEYIEQKGCVKERKGRESRQRLSVVTEEQVMKQKTDRKRNNEARMENEGMQDD